MIVIMSRAVRLCACLSPLWLATAAFRPPPAPRVLRGPRAVLRRGVRRGDDDAGAATGDDDDGARLPATRRAFVARSFATVAAGGAAALPRAVPPARAADGGASAAAPSQPYEDLEYGFRVAFPSAWERREQTLSGRRRGVFFADPASADAASGAVETFGVIAYTPVRDDFTSLSSFGSVDEVAQATIMPKGELAGQADASKMLSAVSKNSAYYFDYVTTPVVPTAPGSGAARTTETLPPQHFRVVFALLPRKNAAGMTLVTVTLQTTEERYGGSRGLFDGVVDSFGKVPN